MEPYVEEPKEEQDEEEDIFCDICEVQMQSASSLIKHKKQKHEPKICPDCGVIVKGEMALKNHRRKHVTTPCPLCSKDIAKSNMNNHLKSCKGQKDKDPKA